METLGRVWNRLSIRRPTLAVSEPPIEEEDDVTPEKTQEVFQMFNGKPRRKSETFHHNSRVVLNQLQNHPPRNSTQSPQRRHRMSENSLDNSRNTLFQNSTDTNIFADGEDAHRDMNVPACSNEEERVNPPRRNSLFVKRGSLTMEPITKVDLEEVYTVNKQLGTGRFGYIKLAEHKESKLRIAIKFFPRPQTKQADFVREYNYSFFLCPHPNIIDTYAKMYQSSDDTAFFFVQEFCPKASLREAVEATNQAGIGEANTKKVFAAVLSAIEFMHDENLVHRNLKAENILIFDAHDYGKVKVTDFGLTRKVDTTVKYLEYVNNYHAAELCDTVVNEKLVVNKSTDIWALGIIFFYCMKGKFPWQKASIMCKPYWEWEQWLKRKNPALPKKFNPFSEKALKLFKKSLTPRFKDRWTAKDMRKCLAKEKLLKSVKRPDDEYYVMIDTVSRPRPSAASSSGEKVETAVVPVEQGKRKSTLQQWISSTLTAMAEISEQVVSARDD
uniref:Protein kinase domain-containing protein n=1 Tax=Caenorhabditis japonica TaxID=281687 RepID=A0A8R1HJZ2_CAEJA